MRRLAATLFTVLTLGLLGGAFAQEDTVPIGQGYWAGASTGFPFGLNLHFGAENLIGQGLHLRGNASVGFPSFGVGADVLAGLPIDTGDAPVNIYAGGGAHISFGNPHRDDDVDESFTHFGIGLLVGAEYRLFEAGLPEGGIFLEAGPAVVLGEGRGSGFGFSAKLGFNYHF